MARITAYPSIAPSTSDLVIGTQVTGGGANQTNPTKNFTVGSIVQATFKNLPAYNDNTAAVAGGLGTGDLFQTTGVALPPLNVAGIVMIVQ